MDFGKLGLSYQIIGKLYDMAWALKEDETLTKEDIFNSTFEIIKEMDELIELLQASQSQAK